MIKQVKGYFYALKHVPKLSIYSLLNVCSICAYVKSIEKYSYAKAFFPKRMCVTKREMDMGKKEKYRLLSYICLGVSVLLVVIGALIWSMEYKNTVKNLGHFSIYVILDIAIFGIPFVLGIMLYYYYKLRANEVEESEEVNKDE